MEWLIAYIVVSAVAAFAAAVYDARSGNDSVGTFFGVLAFWPAIVVFGAVIFTVIAIHDQLETLFRATARVIGRTWPRR